MIKYARKLRIVIVLVLSVVALSAAGAFAQQSQSKCAQDKYSGRLTSPYRYRLQSIEGQAVYGEASEQVFGSASAVCVALVTQKTRRLVAAVLTESDGQFKFPHLVPGKYVLVVSVSELHDVIIPLEIAASPRAKRFKRSGLLLHLRAKDDPKKSYVTPIAQLDLRAELLSMVREDQAIRNEKIRNGFNVRDQELDARMAAIDAANTARLKEIIKRYGWPGPELVSRDGADAAFMLVQHSPDLSFQQAMLPLVRRSYERGKLSAWNFALLQDNVLVREGKPQLYGMSLNHWDGEKPVLNPIEDEANVDKRRAKIGLPPLREYLEFMRRLYFPSQ